MATVSQITANRANAQMSTGPATETGKAASARNSLSHGLSSQTFVVLPHEDPAAYDHLLEALRSEHAPATPTEDLLVADMAQSRWKLERIAGMERELLNGAAEPPEGGASALARWFQQDCGHEQALLKLNRYENSARRVFYSALATLRRLRVEKQNEAKLQALEEGRAFHRKMDACLNSSFPWAARLDTLRGKATAAEPIASETACEPSPKPSVEAATANNKTNPMPPKLRMEWDRHKRRDPLFDPHFDRTQLSKDLRNWFEKNPHARP
jgi:hypothetical protein